MVDEKLTEIDVAGRRWRFGVAFRRGAGRFAFCARGTSRRPATANETENKRRHHSTDRNGANHTSAIPKNDDTLTHTHPHTHTDTHTHTHTHTQTGLQTSKPHTHTNIHTPQQM